MKTHRVFRPLLPVSLLAGGLVLLPGVASAVLVPTTSGPTFGIDDYNTSTLNPSPAIAVSTLQNSQCPWINAG